MAGIERRRRAVLVLYAVVGVTALVTVDAGLLAATDAPLRLVVESGAAGWGGVVRLGAGIAALGVLLNLIPGVSRTTLAMARRRELPGWFAQVDPTRALPLRAELSAAVVVVIVAVVDLGSAIALSGVAVLVYCAITNASALTLSAEQRRWPRAVAVVGLAGCLVLIVSLPPVAVLVGGGVLALGALAHLVRRGQTPA